MDFRVNLYSSLLSFVLLLPAICFAGNDAYISTRATYYGSPDCLGTASGACGYGEYGRTVNYGEVSGVSKLFRNGSGCGACYQVRCKYAPHCTEEGTTVVVTDFGVGHDTDFILSVRAYAKLARTNQALALFAAGGIDEENKRVPCKYQANLLVKVHEHSKFPNYLAIVLLNQGGIYDITAVEVCEASNKQWKAMHKSYGAVWVMANPPKGAVAFRFQVSGNAEVKWVEPNSVLPSEWKAGVAYDTSFQLT